MTPDFAPTNPALPHRPSDELLIQTIADAWHVDFATAYFWILNVEPTTQRKT